jgi:hypothetical protein
MLAEGVPRNCIRFLFDPQYMDSSIHNLELRKDAATVPAPKRATQATANMICHEHVSAAGAAE